MSEPGFRQHLGNQVAVTALIGDRVYRERMPQQHPSHPRGLPAVVFQMVGTVRVVSFCGTQKLLSRPYQFDTYAEDSDQRTQVADAIFAAMVDYSGLMGSVRVNDVKLATEFDVGPDVDPGTYRRSQTYTVWYWEN